MGRNSRKKNISKNRQTRSVKPDNNRTHPIDRSPKTLVEPGVTKPIKESAPKGCPFSGLIPDFDKDGRTFCNEEEMEEIVFKSIEPFFNSTEFDENVAYCGEEQLDEIVLKSLEALYNKVLSKLKDLGYDEATALKAVLKNGHACGDDDVFTNVLCHTLGYLKTERRVHGENAEDEGFCDLEHLLNYSRDGLIRLLQTNRSNLSRGDALWYLIKSRFHLGRAKVMELPHMQSQACVSSSSNEDLDSQDIVGSLSSELGGLNLNEIIEDLSEEQKEEMISRLISQVEDLQKQVEERKEWAQEKAIEAARKVSNDLKELRTLRMDREEKTPELKMGKHLLKYWTKSKKRIKKIENALREASCEVDRTNEKVRKLESENAEVKAEIEAFELSASESVAACLVMSKREKKSLKKHQACEWQKIKLQEEIVTIREEIAEKEQQLVSIKEVQREAEVKYEQEKKAKDLALSQVENEHRLKEEAEANSKRRLKELFQKSRIDLQSHKGDLERLQQELSQLKTSKDSISVMNSEESLEELIEDLDECNERGCLFCWKEELSVVFLPCAHQILCSDCNEIFESFGGHTCPCCQVPIEQRIHIFGASSSSTKMNTLCP